MSLASAVKQHNVGSINKSNIDRDRQNTWLTAKQEKNCLTFRSLAVRQSSDVLTMRRLDVQNNTTGPTIAFIAQVNFGLLFEHHE